MRRNWQIIISTIFTLAIIGLGVYGFHYISTSIPTQLSTPSTILVSGEFEDVNQDQGVSQQSKELSDVIRESQQRVVKIETPDGTIGSGFLYNDKGDIVTNAHVVAGTKDVIIISADMRQLDGTVIGISETTDVALVRVEDLAGEDPLKISFESPAIGDDVLALGSPFGFENTVTTGIISGVNRNFEIPPYNFEDVFQITAPIAQGNSGGPLVNSKTGEVVGINSAVIEQTSIGFSIPILNVIGLLEGWASTPMGAIPNVADDQNAQGHGQSYPYDNHVYSNSEMDLAIFLVSYFYENINFHDFITAYSFLGNSWQTNTTYENFRNGFINIEWITVDDIWVEEENLEAVDTGENLTVITKITVQERKDGRSTFEKYELTYTVGYENDQLKLLSVEEEKLD
ncbi:S1-C subfamily serine protease [Evansella vedderi]|uniref:S1-C subfamily serine protease n=1 Tax=Evansella vedderi TaxID=38282 RepID=A0ABT9ZQ41_9BACI|nr:trypsin-like peptidase domain-containing protein [Evansella vedderi]MDQ0253070.1 S1-C subfamily serine protease [Evansella vedderi]